jgi:hypothetical protein
VKWKAGTLHAGGSVDLQQALYNLFKRGLPLDKLREKVQQYRSWGPSGGFSDEDADFTMRTLEGLSGQHREANEHVTKDTHDCDAEDAAGPVRLTHNQLVQLLKEREKNMQKGAKEHDTDQWRVYKYIISKLTSEGALRLIIQASAGTGKSYLLTTVCLWCLVNRKDVCPAAPTGIAATNVEIHGTTLAATTAHYLFGFDQDLKSDLDLAKISDGKVRKLRCMDVFMLDEASMMDVDLWDAIAGMLRALAALQVSRGYSRDDYGSTHIILSMDLKQLPPATSRPPFWVLSDVRGDFAVRVLRENRRLVTDNAREGELQHFHKIMEDIGWNSDAGRVRDFFINAHLEGAQSGNRCNDVSFESGTSVFTKRRYRDRWNRAIVKRIAKRYSSPMQPRSMQVQGRARALMGRGQWYSTGHTRLIRRRAKTQSPWHLHLAGCWKGDSMLQAHEPHFMRVMLNGNIAVQERFANGTLGRLVNWEPEAMPKGRVPASYRDLSATFVKEGSMRHSELFPRLDFMEINVRHEPLYFKGSSVAFVQLPLIPSYALVGHKVQAMTMTGIVRGCLEGVFAQGHVYVMVSRVTDPKNFRLIGLPPKDLLHDVVSAWEKAGLDVDDCFAAAVAVTGEWTYKSAIEEPNLLARFVPVMKTWQTVPVRHKTLAEILNPQPKAAAVVHEMLKWMDRVDIASQAGCPPPACVATDGSPIIPDESTLWWLTELERRRQPPSGEDSTKRDPEEGPPSDGESLEGRSGESGSEGAWDSAPSVNLSDEEDLDVNDLAKCATADPTYLGTTADFTITADTFPRVVWGRDLRRKRHMLGLQEIN